jgi:1,4-dihydroxy-2-naphthoate octaprenyltransferase
VLGQATVSLLQISSYFLNAYYDSLALEQNGKPWPKESIERRLQTAELQLGILGLTSGAALTLLLFTRGDLGLSGLLLLGIGVLLAYFYAVPPLRLANSGYGELVSAFLITNLMPALAFLLQSGDLHRLLPMLTFPLTALYLAMTLSQDLATYAGDIKSGKMTLMLRIGWQAGMLLHNLLVLSAFILLALAALLGLAWSLAWPGFIALPVGLFQVWQMLQIGRGERPNWKMLLFTSAASFGLAAYLIAFTLWIR